MTSDRDQLAELIHDTVYSGAQRVTWEDIADAILAAGWRAPVPTHWDCGHEIAVGAWGHHGEGISCAHKRWVGRCEDDVS